MAADRLRWFRNGAANMVFQWKPLQTLHHCLTPPSLSLFSVAGWRQLEVEKLKIMDLDMNNLLETAMRFKKAQ